MLTIPGGETLQKRRVKVDAKPTEHLDKVSRSQNTLPFHIHFGEAGQYPV